MSSSSAPIETQNPIRAAFWMIGAIVAFSSMAVSGRTISAELDTFELMMYRSMIGVFLVAGIGHFAGTLGQISTRSFGLHIVRNAAHFAGQNLWFAALTMIPLAQVFALEFTSPIWVVLLAPIFLGEKLTRLRVLVALIGFIGVLIVARPDVSNLNVGLLFGALAAVGFAGSAIFTKILTRTETITCILFWLVVLQFLFGVVLATWDGAVAWPSLRMWPWVFAVSIAGLGAHFCLTKALALASAATVMPLDFARLPLIAIIGAVVYDEALDPWVILGAALIFTANYINILASNRPHKTNQTKL